MRITLVPGIVASAMLAAAATYLARFAPILGAPVIAILLGVAFRSFAPLPEALGAGVAFAGRTVLQVAIVISGFGIPLATVFRTGLGTLPVTIGTIAIALGLAPILGRLLGVGTKLRDLIGIGTAICGASAIVAATSVIEPTEAEASLAIATIFFYNVVAVLAFPALGHALGLTQDQFGTWAGTAINDTSSVVAAGVAYGHEATAHATIVKLTRATLILPLVAAMALHRARTTQAVGTRVTWARIVPWFIVWFFAAALANSIGIVPSSWHDAIAAVAVFLISAALAAIGLQTALGRLFGTGARALGLGFLLWVAAATSSLGIQRAIGR